MHLHLQCQKYLVSRAANLLQISETMYQVQRKDATCMAAQRPERKSQHDMEWTQILETVWKYCNMPRGSYQIKIHRESLVTNRSRLLTNPGWVQYLKLTRFLPPIIHSVLLPDWWHLCSSSAPKHYWLKRRKLLGEVGRISVLASPFVWDDNSLPMHPIRPHYKHWVLHGARTHFVFHNEYDLKTVEHTLNTTRFLRILKHLLC